MSLFHALSLCNPSDTDELANVYRHYSDDRRFEEHLLLACHQESIQRGATWILKHHLETGFQISVDDEWALLKVLSKELHWESILHLLQSIPYFSLDEVEPEELFRYLHKLLSHSNKLVRAWGYNALAELANSHDEYQEQVTELLNLGQQDEAPSVQARIRNILSSNNFS